MTDQDVRDMLRRKATSVRPSGDGWEQIEAKLVAPAAGRRPVPKPLLVAAALVAVALTSIAVFGQRDKATSIDLRPADTTTTVLADRSGVGPPTLAADLPPGVWPWPTDDLQSPQTDPVETARAYIESRIGLSDATTVSAYQAGDSNSGEVTFGGDIQTTVFVRRLDGLWHVEGAASDLVTVQDGGEGTTTARVEADGWLMSFTRLSSGSSSPLVPASAVQVGDEIKPGLVFDFDNDRTVKSVRFLLTTADGTKGLSEVRLAPPFQEMPVPANAVSPEGGLDARETVVAYLNDRLRGRSIVVNDFTATDEQHGEVTWESGVVVVEKSGEHWFVTEAIGDSVQIASAERTGEAGILEGEIRVAEPGTLHITDTSSMGTIDIEVEDAGEGTLISYRTGNESTWPGPLRVVFETATGFVSLAERVVG